jgi:hypothetical protein
MLSIPWRQSRWFRSVKYFVIFCVIICCTCLARTPKKGWGFLDSDPQKYSVLFYVIIRCTALAWLEHHRMGWGFQRQVHWSHSWQYSVILYVILSYTCLARAPKIGLMIPETIPLIPFLTIFRFIVLNIKLYLPG